jgi:hypothetical protein
VKVDFEFYDLHAEIEAVEPVGAGNRERIFDGQNRVPAIFDLGMRLYFLAEQARLLREQARAVIEQRWSLQHDVADDAVDARFMKGPENVAVIGKRHLSRLGVFLGSKGIVKIVLLVKNVY